MTPPDDVSAKLSEIRERVEAATEGPWLTSPEGAGIYPDTGEVWAPVEESEAVLSHQVVCRMNQHFQPDEDAEFVAAARSDVPYLLSLVGYLREELCLRTCNCGPTDLDPEKHAGYCNYVEAIEEISAALRDAAQEGAE